jgi:hypothetical protein
MGANDKSRATFYPFSGNVQPAPPMLQKQWWIYVGPKSFWVDDPDIRFGIEQNEDYPDGPINRTAKPIIRNYLTENVRTEFARLFDGGSQPGDWREICRTKIFRHFIKFRQIGDGLFIPARFDLVEVRLETGGHLPGQWFQCDEPEGLLDGDFGAVVVKT